MLRQVSPIWLNHPAEAEQWRAELAAGRFPVDIENER
jgi:hypothetical protein